MHIIDSIPQYKITDVDECTQATDDCHLNATCDNTIGSYSCECATGLTGNGIVCDGMYMYMLQYSLKYTIITVQSQYG
mgnify:FL=1